MQAHAWILILMTALSTACNSSSSPKDGAPEKKKKTDDANPAATTGSGEGEEGANAREGEGEGEGEGASEGASEGEGAGEGGTGDCPAAFDSALASAATIKIPSLIGEVTVDAAVKVTIKGGPSSASVAMNLTTKSVKPALAAGSVKKTIDTLNKPWTITVAKGEARTKLFASAAWKGLDCIVIPVTKLVTGSIEATYDPALPLIIAPTGSDDDYKLLAGRSFSIKANSTKVLDGLEAGEHQGTAKFSSSGDVHTIAYDFGGNIPTVSSVPFGKMAYDVDQAAKAYKAVTVEAIIDKSSKTDITITK